jgi:predicted MFS family arabinose efflux permease
MGIMIAGRWGFDTAFYLFAATMGLTFLTIFFRLPQPAATHERHPLTVMRALKGYEALLRRREVVFAAVGYFLMYFGLSVFTVYLPTWLERTLGATSSAIATMFLIGGIANVLSGPQAGKLSDRVGRKRIILLACGGLATLMLLTPIVTRAIWVAYPIFFLFMVMQAMRTSPYSALLTSLVDDSRRGSLMSFTVAIGQLGLSAGSALAGVLYESGSALSGPLFGHGYGLNAALGAASVLSMGILVWTQIPEPDAGGPSVASGAGDVEPSPA